MYKVGDKFIIEIEESCGADGFSQSNVWGVKGFSPLAVREETLNLLEKYVPSDAGYEKGLSDAWKVAKKICLNPDDGGIDFETIEKIFGATPYAVMKSNTPQEAIDKLKAWEEKQEIKVGDVVRVDDLVGDFVVTWNKEKTAHCMSLSTGAFCVRNHEKLAKTGKHIDLTEIFKGLEGEDAN